MTVETPSSPKHIVVFCNCGSEAEAERIAVSLVKRRLVACVNISAPIRSIYRWQGKIEISPEWTLAAKSTSAHFNQIRDTIQALHSYQVPEIIALPVVAGSAPYLNWIDDSV